MRYSVIVQRRAQKRIARFPTDVQNRIEKSLQELSEEPRPPGSRKLQEREGWRIRVGDYRTVYEIDDVVREVLIIALGYREDSVLAYVLQLQTTFTTIAIRVTFGSQARSSLWMPLNTGTVLLRI